MLRNTLFGMCLIVAWLFPAVVSDMNVQAAAVEAPAE